MLLRGCEIPNEDHIAHKQGKAVSSIKAQQIGGT